MGSKGNTTTSTQQQSYTPNPAIAAAGTQALTGAQQAAASPFNMPQAPVAGFTPFQQQAFGQTQALQGMAQPYFNEGQQYLQNSAQNPVTSGQVASYYNPMAQNVTAQMQNIFGQQNQATLGQLTGAAGGVGADRIAVGQSELANQQGLAAGQTYAGLYGQALQGAQQQNQMQAGAGYGLSQMGPAALNAQLMGTSALGSAGSQQQQLAQAQMNAPYQQQLAQIAYPFQTAQYLSGITGGLAPAFGGSTYGQSTTTSPTPSPLAQGLGIGTSLLGMLGTGGMSGLGSLVGGGLGLKGASGSLGAANAIGTGNYGLAGQLPYAFKRGGRAYDDGGATDGPQYSPPEMPQNTRPNPFSGYGKLASHIYAQAMGPLTMEAMSGNPYASEAYQNLRGSLPSAAGGGVMGDDSEPPAVPGGSLPVGHSPFGGTALTPIPFSPLPYGGNPQAHTQFQMRPPSPPAANNNVGNDVNAAVKMGTALLPFLARGGHTSAGGEVNPYSALQGFDDGGDVSFNGLAPEDFPAQQDAFAPFQAIGKMIKDYGAGEGTPNVGPSAAEASVPPPNSPELSPPLARAPAQAAQPMGNVPMPQGRPQEASLVDPSAPLSDVYRAGHSTLSKAYGPQVASAIMGNLGVESPTLNPSESHDNGTGIGIAGWKDERRDALYDYADKQGLDPTDRRTQFSFLQHEMETNPHYSDMLTRMQNAKSPAEAARIFRTEYERPAGTTEGQPLGMGRASQLATNFSNGNFSGVGGTRYAGVPSSPANASYTLPQEQMPYPNALKEPPMGGMFNNPLVAMGARMAQTRGPIGSVIGAGLEAAGEQTRGERKELRTDEDVNLKAQQLHQQAQIHLDEYNRLKPYEAQRLGIEEKRLEMMGQRYNALPAGAVNTIANQVRSDPGFIGRPEEEIQAEILRRAEFASSVRKGSTGSAGTPGGTSAATAVADPGEGQRVKGHWYIGPSGKPQQWNG